MTTSPLQRLLDQLPRRRELKRLRAKWGQPGAKEVIEARRYFDLTCDTAAAAVDARTWGDLELPKVFADLDTTESPLGSQYLYRQLRTSGRSSEELARYHACCRVLGEDAGLREKIQLQLSGLKDDANAQLADGIHGETPKAKTGVRVRLTAESPNGLGGGPLMPRLQLGGAVVWFFAISMSDDL